MVIIFGIILCLVIAAVCLSFKSGKSDSKIPTSPTASTSKVEDDGVPVFKQSWNFLEFRRKFDKIQLGEFPDKYRAGKLFKAIIFKKGNKCIFVGFYNMKELTEKELRQQKNELKIGLKENGRYYLYKGDMPYKYPLDLE